MRYDDEFARQMVDWHVDKAAYWLAERADKVTIYEREWLLHEFQATQDAALQRLRNKLITAEGAPNAT